MQKQQRGRHLAPKTCRHRETRSSAAGLERVVCDKCGHVSVRYVGNGATVDDIIINDIGFETV
ncbi:MAG: hypothetical protein U9N56_09410 [Actinomycetota bacterium]|nr:hypothetical protein [Actinomycetota bacterium]